MSKLRLAATSPDFGARIQKTPDFIGGGATFFFKLRGHNIGSAADLFL